MRTTLLSLLLLGVGLLLTTKATAQITDLTKERAFFEKASKNYQQFLDSTEFGKVIRLDTVQIFSDKVILDLVMTDYGRWASLAHQYEKDFEMDIRKTLLDKATFLFEIEDDSLGIRIWSADFTLCEVQLYYSDEKFNVIENANKGVRLDSLVLDKKQLPKIAKKNTEQSIEYCKGKIEQRLVAHYKKHKDATIKINSARPNELKMKVHNIRGEVIEDNSWFPYWEYLVITVTFKEQKGQFRVYYKVQAKYGSGIFSGPRLSDYTDMDNDYKEYVDNYMDSLNEIIFKAIK